MHPVRGLGAAARSTLALAGWLGLVACGGGETEPYTIVRSDVQKQCDSLMSVWCESSLGCVQSGREPEDVLTDVELADEQKLCIDTATRVCDTAIRVSDGYDSCRASVETLGDADCEAVREAVRTESDVPMPASCSEVFPSE